MALSPDCIEQHKKEQAITRRWLGLGLVCATGLHGALIPLLRPMSPLPLGEPEAIELIVIAPTGAAGQSVQSEDFADTLEPQASPTAAPENTTEEPETRETSQISKASDSSNADSQTSEPLDSPNAEDSSNPEDSEQLDDLHGAEAANDEPEISDSFEGDDLTEPTDESDKTAAISEETTPDTETASDAEMPPDTEMASNAEGTSNAETPSGQSDVAAGAEAGVVITDGAGDSATGVPVAALSTGDGSGRTDAEEKPQPEVSFAPTGPGTTRFGCRTCFRPEYPDEARAVAAEGTSKIHYDVDADGNVINVSLALSSGNAALDAAALNAVRQYKFTAGGQGRTRTIEINFSREGSERSQAAQRRGERRTVVEPMVEAAGDESTQPLAVSDDTQETAGDDTPSEVAGTGVTRPAVAEEEEPTVAGEEMPAVVLDAEPAVAEKVPAVVLDAEPAVAGEEMPAVVLDAEPAVAEKVPAVVLDAERAVAGEETPAVVLDAEPAAAAEDGPEVAVEKQPEPDGQESSPAEAAPVPEASSDEAAAEVEPAE